MRDVKVSRIRSVERAIHVLNAFSIQQPELSIDQIVAITQLPKATIYRLLYTLEYHGLIRYDGQSSLYRPGFQLLNYGGILLSTLAIRAEADEALNQLQVETHQTVLMGIVEAHTLVYVDTRETNEGLKYSSYIGRPRPLTYGVLGRLLLAFQSSSVIDDILSRPIAASTAHTLVEPEVVRRQLDRIRQDGYFMEVDQTIPGATGVSAPIFNAFNQCIAAVGVVGPSVVLTGQELQRVTARVIEAATEISRKMGWRHQSPQSNRS